MGHVPFIRVQNTCHACTVYSLYCANMRGWSSSPLLLCKIRYRSSTHVWNNSNNSNYCGSVLWVYIVGIQQKRSASRIGVGLTISLAARPPPPPYLWLSGLMLINPRRMTTFEGKTPILVTSFGQITSVWGLELITAVKAQSNELTRRPPELVQHFRL